MKILVHTRAIIAILEDLEQQNKITFTYAELMKLFSSVFDHVKQQAACQEKITEIMAFLRLN